MELSGADTPLDGEDRKDRLDRETSEVLDEVRVALPGVQVLFAFLLALPFQSRWEAVPAAQRSIYFAALCLALLSTLLLVLPSAWHRVNYRAYDKRRLIILGSRCTLAGLASAAGAMCGVLFVIADELYDARVATAIGIAAAIVFTSAWGLLPVRDRARFRARHASNDDGEAPER